MSAPRKHLDKITTDKMISCCGLVTVKAPWRDRDGHDRSKFVLFCKAQTLFSLWTPSPRVYIYIYCYMLYVIWYRIYYIVYNLTVCVFSYCIFTTSLLMANFEWDTELPMLTCGVWIPWKVDLHLLGGSLHEIDGYPTNFVAMLREYDDFMMGFWGWKFNPCPKIPIGCPSNCLWLYSNLDPCASQRLVIVLATLYTLFLLIPHTPLFRFFVSAYHHFDTIPHRQMILIFPDQVLLTAVDLKRCFSTENQEPWLVS